MELTQDVRDQLRRTVTLLDRVPDGVWIDLDSLGLRIQLGTQAEVRDTRRLFPGAIWTKRRSDSGWWEYETRVDHVPVRLYGVYEAPPTCRATEVVEMVEERVAVEFETRTVEKRRLVWDCSGDDA